MIILKTIFFKSDSDQSDLDGSDLKDVLSDIDEHMIILDAQNISESIRQIKKILQMKKKRMYYNMYSNVPLCHFFKSTQKIPQRGADLGQVVLLQTIL